MIHRCIIPVLIVTAVHAADGPVQQSGLGLLTNPEPSGALRKRHIAYQGTPDWVWGVAAPLLRARARKVTRTSDVGH